MLIKDRRYRVWSASAVLLLAGGLLAVGGCERKREVRVAKREIAVPVTLHPVHIEPVERSIEVVGTLWGDEDVLISNKVPGKVVEVYKDVGDRAEPGEPLAQLLKNDYELDRNQKESALQESLAKLGLKDVPGANFDPTKLPSVVKAKLGVDNAESKMKRGKQLHDQTPPLISDQDYADLVNAWDIAKSAYDAEVLVVRGLASEAKTRAAELAIANQALADTTIRAPRITYPAGVSSSGQPTPDDGQPRSADIHASKKSRSYVVVARMASVAELERAVTPMFRVVDDDPVKLRANVPERYVSDIKIAQRVDVRIEAYKEVFRGDVARVNPQIDPSNRTFQVEVLIPNPKHQLPPGAFARANVYTRTDSKVVFVPHESVVSFAGINKVFTVKDGKAVEHIVELGERKGEYVEAIKGMEGGEQVVVGGASKLASGVPVTIQKTETEKPVEAKPLAASAAREGAGEKP